MNNSQQLKSFKKALKRETDELVDSMGREELSNSTPFSNDINRPKVLMYHRIVEDRKLSDHQDTCLHIDEFNKQLQFIDRLGYTPITLKDYLLCIQNELQLPKKPIILTFDDGYLDTYELAVPLLKEYGMKAVIFVLGDRSISSNVWDLNVVGITQAPLMRNKHILELHENGFEIGTHTFSHIDLVTSSSENYYREISKPKIILETLLGGTVTSISYPYGMVNQRVKNYVLKAGYKFACSVFSGPPIFGADLFEIRRITVHSSTSVLGFVTRLVVPYEYIEWIWWKSIRDKHRSGPEVST